MNTRVQGFELEIRQVVAGFVADVSSLAQRAALEGLQRALGEVVSPRTSAAPMRLSQVHGRYEKRSGDDLDALADTFAAFVARKPGLRIEQINKELGTSTKELALPIRKLIADGTLKTKGAKRARQYFPSTK